MNLKIIANPNLTIMEYLIFFVWLAIMSFLVYKIVKAHSSLKKYGKVGGE